MNWYRVETIIPGFKPTFVDWFKAKDETVLNGLIAAERKACGIPEQATSEIRLANAEELLACHQCES